MRTRLLCLSAWLLAACTEKPAPPADAAPAPHREAAEQRAPDAAQPEQAKAEQAPLEPVPGQPKRVAPARGCVVRQDVALGPAQQAWALYSIESEQVLVLGSDRRTLERWQLSVTPKLLSTLKVAQPIAKLFVLHAPPPAVAFVDDKGDVWLLRAELTRPERIAQGADRRFAPALGSLAGQLLVAFTKTVDEAMHTFVARVGKPELRDVTPAGHGATAASFALGVAPPVLVMLDAHEGISPLLEVPFGEDGTPRAAIVRTPISQPYAPPLLAVAQVPHGELEVAFSAIGKLAATAIGRVPLRRAVGPVALHPSRGYGELSFDVAITGRAVVFALEVPLGEAPKADRALELKWLDAKGEGETVVIGAGSGSPRAPSLAGSKAAGELLLTYVAEQTAHASLVTCDH